jgi:hypothetical protein
MKLKLSAFLSILILLCSCEKKAQKTTVSPKDQTTNILKENSSESDIQFTLDEKIKIIKSNFSTIENQLSSFEKKQAEEGETGGITEKIAYFDNGIPQKVKLGNYGEHGAEVLTFYLKDNKLFFVFKEEFSEASLNGPFTKKEMRYYIYDDVLIRVLEKEKTSKSTEIDISKVQNVDFTDQWQTKQEIINDFKKALRETAVSLVETKTVGLENARWISVDDPKSGIEIKDGKFIMFYEGIETKPSSIFDYELYEESGIEYIRIKNDAEQQSYGLLEYTSETMVLSHLGRGNTLKYRKEK